jgi:hypothetical protein
MSVKVAPVFPTSAPLTRNPKVPQKYRPVLWEQYLLPTLAENLATLLGISVGFLPESIVGAVFERGKFKPGTGWALARFRINLQEEQVPAFLLQPLAEALDWGAIGMRRPPATREAPVVGKEGVQLSEAQEMDLAAYHEVCNVVTCGVLARAWRSKLERPLYILLDGVEAVVPAQFPAELENGKWVILQASFGYSERPVKPVKGQPPQYEKQTVWLFVVSEVLALKALWGAPDGKEKDKTAWLVSTGQWT